MTIPFQGLPDTRPGYAFQSGGDLGALSGGLDAVLAALIQRQKLAQDDQALGIQQQQVDQQGAWQQGQLAQDQARQQAADFAAIQARQLDQAVGQGLGQLAQPDMPMQVPIPGIGSSTAAIPAMTLAEVLQQAPPEARAKIIKEGMPLEEKREAAALEKRKSAAKQAYLQSLSPDLRALEVTRSNAREAGLDESLVKDMLEQTYAKGANPKTIQEIDRRHPEWVGFSPLQKIELALDEAKAITNRKFAPPPGLGRAGISTDAERKSAGWFKRAAQANLRFPKIETPSWVTAQVIMRDPGGTGNVLSGKEARSWYQNVLQFAQAILRKDTGATINDQEIGWIMNTYIPLPGDDEAVKAQKDEARLGVLDELRINAGRAFEGYDAPPGQSSPPMDAWAQKELQRLRGGKAGTAAGLLGGRTP